MYRLHAIACWWIRARSPARIARCRPKKKRGANGSAPRRYSGIVEYSFAPDSRHLLIPLNGDLYVYDLARKRADAVRRLTNTDAYETDARFSPRSNFVSFMRDQNLFVIDLATGKERAVTREGGGLVSFGMAEFIAQEEMDRDTGYWWSPDERHIALARVDESPVAEVERFEIQADGRPVVRQRYPATGARNARVDLFVADLGAESRLQLDLGADADIYLPRRRLVPGQPRHRRAAPEPRPENPGAAALRRAVGGRGRVLLTEHSDIWVPLHHELTFLQRTPQFIWASSRDGFQHLYLYGNDGTADPPAHLGRIHGGRRSHRGRRFAPSTSARAGCISPPTCPRRSSGSCSGCRWTSRRAPQRVTAGRGLARHHDVDRMRASSSTRFRMRTRRATSRCARPAAQRCRDAAQQARRDASVRALLDEHVRAGVRHDRRGRRPDDALQIAQAAHARRRASVIR